MKANQLLKYKLLIICILISAFSSFGMEQIEKKKYIEKNFNVNENTELQIINKFGKVEINTWEQNTFNVKAEVIGKGRTEERAQRYLDQIEIKIDESSSEISFETILGISKSKNDEGFEINYTVHMPDVNPLSIKNGFGDVLMGDRNSNLKLEVKYGSIKAGDVTGFTDLTLAFGSGSINDITNGEIEVKYSKLNIGSAADLEVYQGFSDLKTGEIKNLEIESKYGDIEIEKVDDIEAEVHYSGFEIEELIKSIELECSYIGKFVIERLSKEFTSVDIDGKYSSYEIGLAPELNGTIEAAFSYSGMKIDPDVDVEFHYKVKESHRSTYRGKIGNGDNNKQIKVDSSYGNLRLKMD